VAIGQVFILVFILVFPC